MFKRKTRSLTVRLSEEEYEQLVQHGVARGAYSVSDYARTLLSRTELAYGDLGIRKRFSTLDSNLRALEENLSRLRNELGLSGE